MDPGQIDWLLVGAIHELPLPVNRFCVRWNQTDHPSWKSGPDKRVPPEEADLTSRSLRKKHRRGTLVVPGEAVWIIEREKRT